jgi:hypothetical protein
MIDLLKERLIRLLSEPTQVTNEEIQHAYGCFMEQLKLASQSERNYSNVFRMLNATRIELVFLQSLYRYDQGEKCLKNSLYSENCHVS